MSLFAYDVNGKYLVVVDGNELLVHGGVEDEPLWRVLLSSPLAAVQGFGPHIVSLEESGELALWDASQGLKIKSLAVEGAPAALSMSPGGCCAVLTSNSLRLLDLEQGATLNSVELERPTCAAWSDDGQLLAVGLEAGKVYLFDAQLQLVRRIRIDAPTRGVAWNSNGFWLATGGERVFDMPREGGSCQSFTRAGGMAPSAVVCSPDGSKIALQLAPKLVIVLDWPGKNTIAQLRYHERDIAGVGFGPAPWFGVGLVGGDGNMVNWETEMVYRTDPHPGRPMNRWALNFAVGR